MKTKIMAKSNEE